MSAPILAGCHSVGSNSEVHPTDAHVAAVPGNATQTNGSPTKVMALMQVDPGNPTLRISDEASPWAAYDTRLITAIKTEWFHVLDQNPRTAKLTGKVIVEFQLQHDGTASNLKVPVNTCGKLGAQAATNAISRACNTSPQPWPNALRRIVPKDFRKLTFTFHYDFRTK